jgi:hypothetical protein
VSYGSILDPLSYGSGGWGDNSYYGGGGIVRLVVGGALTVDGTIAARGFGYALWGEEVRGGAGSGGSINLTAASLSGAGTIDANGGNNGVYGPGSGGRVRIALTGSGATFDTFAGTIQAIGGSMENANAASVYDISPAAAGTVCLATADGAPVVKVDNVFRYGNDEAAWRVATGEAIPSATHLPAMQDGDTSAALKATEWELSGYGAIRLTRDVTIAKLTIASADRQKVYTDGHTLKVASLTVDGEAKKGVFTANDVSWIVGEGSVVVGKGGFVVFVR